MYKIFRADKDAYINNRVISSHPVTASNTGAAATLDLFKLYGVTMTSGTIPNVELSRLLIHFDLDDLRSLVTAGDVDITNPSFKCNLKLFDVYGGQPTPANFTISVYPLSKSFDEGIGKDVVMYSDYDLCNYMSASSTSAWIMSGAMSGAALPNNSDYITSASIDNSIVDFHITQSFVLGTENLDVDITPIVSATIANLLPDAGFRISLHQAHETDTKTYFVKRFASRDAFNADKRPQLVMKFDDSVQDDTQLLTLDSDNYMFLYNHERGALTNIMSASIAVTGSNSIVLRLITPVSGGFTTFTFNGSQHTYGVVPVNGIYSASVYLSSSNASIASHLALSGSVDFIPIWGSLDGTVSYLTGSKVTARPQARSSTLPGTKKLVVNVGGISDSVSTNETPIMNVNIFDHTSPLIKLVKTPVELPGLVVRDVHYSIRDYDTGFIVVPFDTEYNSTRVSSDSSGMFFKLDTGNLTVNRTYVVDIMVDTGTNRRIYSEASSPFKVSNL